MKSRGCKKKLVLYGKKTFSSRYRAYTIGSIGVASDPSLPKDPVPPVVALLVKLLGLGQISI